MTCLEVQELLSAFIDNKLDENKKKEMQEHIESCSQCKKDVNELNAIIAELSSLEDVPLPESFHERLHDALALEGEKIRNSKKLNHKNKWMNWKRMSSIAAVFLVGLFTVILYNNNLDEFNKQNVCYNYVSDDKTETESREKTDDSRLKESNDNAGNVEQSISSDKSSTQSEEPVNNRQDLSAKKSVEDSSKVAEGSNDMNPVPDQTELPLNSVSESQLLKSISTPDSNEELNGYLEQLDEILNETSYEVNSYTKDEAENIWFIDVTITTTDSEGKEIKESAVYCGQDGKLWKKEL